MITTTNEILRGRMYDIMDYINTAYAVESKWKQVMGAHIGMNQEFYNYTGYEKIYVGYKEVIEGYNDHKYDGNLMVHIQGLDEEIFYINSNAENNIHEIDRAYELAIDYIQRNL